MKEPNMSKGRSSEHPIKVGVLLTLADLYRKSMPGTSQEYTRYWRKALEETFGSGASLHFPPTAHTSQEVAAGVRSCEQEDCELLVVLPMAYAPSGAAIDALSATDLPILVVSTSRDATLGERITHEDLRANQAMHGVQDLANLLRRRKRRFALLAGHSSQDRFRRRLAQVCRAAAGAGVLRHGRVGRLGTPFAGMLDFSYSPALLTEELGFRVVELKPELLGERAAAVGQREVEECMDWARSSFTVDPELSEEEFVAAATWSAALERIVEAHDLSGIAMNFQAVLGAGAATLPFLGADRLMSRGIGYAGEGDVLTAALNRTLHCICGEATFTETFCPDYGRGEILLSHMGECNPALADPDREILLRAKPFSIGRCTRPAVPVFQLKPGIVTLASLSEVPAGAGGDNDEAAGFQLVVFRGEIVSAEAQPELISPYSRLRISGDLAEFLEEYSKAGGTHHLALGYGDRIGELSDLATFLALGFDHIGD
jgi:L-arabinose isomerase